MYKSDKETGKILEEESWSCKVFGEDAQSAGGESGKHSAYVEIQNFHIPHDTKHNILSGVTTLMAGSDAIIHEDGKMILVDDAKLEFGEAETSRRKSRYLVDTVDVTKTVLVVRVKASQESTTSSVNDLRNNVFGGGGDIYNLKSQMEGCSYGRVKIEKPVDALGVIDDGVIEVDVGSPSDADRKSVV